MTLFYSLGGSKETVTGRNLALIGHRHSRNGPHEGWHRFFGFLQNLDLAVWNCLGGPQSDAPSVPWSGGVPLADAAARRTTRRG